MLSHVCDLEYLVMFARVLYHGHSNDISDVSRLDRLVFDLHGAGCRELRGTWTFG